MALQDNGLDFFRWPFREAASGTAPTSIEDTGPNGYDLTTVNYGSGNMAWVEPAANRRGLESTSTTGTQRVSRAVGNSGDALRTALAGKTQLTIELKFRPDAVSASTSRIVALNNRAGATPAFGLTASAMDNFRVQFDAGGGPLAFGPWTLTATTEYVMHIVIDTPNATAADRVRVYLGGTLNQQIGGAMTQNATLTLPSDLDVICLNRESSGSFDRSMDGLLSYAAIYIGDLGATAIANNATELASNDDEGGSGPTPIAFTGTIPTLTGTVGAAFSEDLSGYFSGTETPFSYAVQSGTLPAGLSLNSSTGVISGTPTTSGTATGIVIRGTDATPDTADSNSFSIDISPAAATSMTIALKQSDGTTAAASITGIEYAILNAATLAAATAILDTGTGESTDGSGNLVLDITGLGLVGGNVRYVLAGKSNGTVGADFDGWQGPATAA